jgi:lipid A ethanolaminephosphotransferase
VLNFLKKTLTIKLHYLVISVALFFSIVCNNSFYQAFLADYPLQTTEIGFLFAVIFGLFSLHILVLSLVCWQKTTKPVLIFLCISSACVAYFMDAYNVMINVDVVRNSLNTDSREMRDLFSSKLIVYVFLLGVLPSYFIFKASIIKQSAKQIVFAKLKLVGILFAINLLFFLYYGAAFASFFREHKSIRYYANPANYIYAVTKVAVRSVQNSNQPLVKIGEDAELIAHKKRELVILVVGETVRADHFSLNGYSRQTNPMLAKHDLVSFTDVTSCGTSTNISLPCMFSNFTEVNYDGDRAKHTEDLLDVLQRAGVSILWRDNNSSSKGVADRVAYEDWRDPKLNKICDVDECRDVGMLGGLQEFVNKQKGHIFIVLHQMGSHGPAYFKRYPAPFEQFKPTCKTNDLEQCSSEEIINAYDNTILYTDYFLDETIKLLQKNQANFNVAMFYVGDHGESLGEHGLYLHGVPNFIAPTEQRKVPLIAWLGDGYQHLAPTLKTFAKIPINHDYVFHTMLSIMRVQTKLHNPTLDLTVSNEP